MTSNIAEQIAAFFTISHKEAQLLSEQLEIWQRHPHTQRAFSEAGEAMAVAATKIAVSMGTLRPHETLRHLAAAAFTNEASQT